MKKRIIGIVSFVFACAFTCFFLVVAGYFYLNNTVKLKMKRTEQNISDAPYEFALPDNKSILFAIGEKKIALYLDFFQETLYISDKNELLEFPFEGSFDYTVQADRSLLADLIDAVGGISLTVSDETLRYTGTQVLEKTEDGRELDGKENMILHALIQKIAENGLTAADFKMIIEQSKTNLTVPDCYLWEEKIDTLFAHAVFIDEDS